MDTVETRTGQFYIRFQQSIASIWYTLRQPETTGVCLAIVLAILLTGLLIPQQGSLDITTGEWVATLPTWLQPWGIPLYWLGLSRVFQTFWFWLPVAFLLLSCAIALADYFQPCRQRVTENPTDLEWQHPLSCRVEHTVRLPATPDELLDDLKASLETQNFIIDDSADENGRLVSATSRRSSWWAVLVIYSGLGLLCFAFLVSYFTLQTETLNLQPFKATTSRLFDGTFELRGPDANGSSGTLIFSESDEITSLPVTRPALFERTLLIPTASEPVLTVTVADVTGELRRLLPLRTELSPATYLNLPVGNPDEPLFFLIPNTALLFQILPASVLDDNLINLQIGIEGEAEPLENRMLPLGEPFAIRDFTITVALNRRITVTAWRDWAMPLYGVSLMMITVSGLLLYFRPPRHIWLIPDVKGRGGQLYGVVEKLGRSPQSAVQFLERLLDSETTPSDSPAPTPDDTQ